MLPSGNDSEGGPVYPGVNPDIDVFDDDTDSEEGEVSSSHSSDQDENDIYPPQFPLSPAVYEPHEIAEDEADDNAYPSLNATEDNHQFRQFTALYPYEFLDPDGVWKEVEPRDAPLPIGQFRKDMYQHMASTGAGGEMKYVEFVPPWTDPDWSDRFIFTGRPGEDMVNDVEYKMYAKKGMLQTQRPALRDEDRDRNPTAAAKRYGVDPTKMDDVNYGNSGVTPTQGSFNVQLEGYPRVTPSNQGLRNVVDQDDYDAVFDRYRTALGQRGGFATEDDFKRVLSQVAAGNPNPALGPACDAPIASALLQYMVGMDQLILRNEYQRVLFGGSTSNEVCTCCAQLATHSW